MQAAITAVTTAIFSLLLYAASAAAEETSAEAVEQIAPIYQVEFILLRPRFRDDLDSEDWDALDETAAAENTPQTPTQAETEAPQQPLTQTPYFGWVAEGEWDLPYTVKRIQRSDDYEVLMHRSWRQQSTPRDNPVPYVLALAFDDNNQALPVVHPSQQTEAPAADTAAAWTTPDNGFQQAHIPNASPFQSNDNPTETVEAPLGVYGTLSFSQARFLHFSVDLSLTEVINNPSSPQSYADVAAAQAFGGHSSNASSGYGFNNLAAYSESLGLTLAAPVKKRRYQLSETRRIKTEVTHYFDHPAFGVLLHARRLTPEETDAYLASMPASTP